MKAWLYDHKWRKIRTAFLAEHPLCSMCESRGRTEAATVVDHIKPHKGNPSLFYNEANLQPLCKPCHDSHKKRQEQGGGVMGCDTNGIPIDPWHHWR